MTSNLTREHATDTEIQMLIDSHEKGTAMFMRTDAYYFMAKELQERRKAERQADELTMWIKRLVRSLKNANPDSKLPREAMDYLTAKGLISVGDILR